MTGLIQVIEMLGNTIAALEQDNARLREENDALSAQLAETLGRAESDAA